MNQEHGQRFLLELPAVQSDLPFSPALLPRLFRLTDEDGRSPLEAIAAAIAEDQGLSSRVLAMAGRDADYYDAYSYGWYPSSTFGEDLISAGSVRSVATGTNSTHSIWKNSQNPYYWLGGTFEVTALDPVKFYADVIYGAGAMPTPTIPKGITAPSFVRSRSPEKRTKSEAAGAAAVRADPTTTLPEVYACSSTSSWASAPTPRVSVSPWPAKAIWGWCCSLLP